MMTIKHKFLSHKINSYTETLIIGTFNPDATGNPADFFYGRGRNYLWRLLPTAFGEPDLKGKSKNEKLDFIKRKKIDFIDLISEVDVEEETNYYDGYLDSRVSESQWRDVKSEIEKLKPIKLKRVCFTRKSFADIPKIKRRIDDVQKFCEQNKIEFKFLTTPARFYRADKQEEWTNFLINDNR